VSKAHSLVQRPKQKPKSKDATPVNSPNVTHVGETVLSPPVNKLHLELFHHFVTNVLTSLGFDKSCFENPAFDMTNCALTAPFLMNQVLAFAALHMSIIRPEKQEFYRNHASQLQTHALSEFNGTKLDINAETCLPTFFFSSVLAMHVLSDKLLYRPHNFEVFLDHFIQSLRMHHGVRAITGQFWDVLLESPLKSFLEGEGKALDQGSSGHECLELLSHVDAMPFDTITGDAYRRAIEHLQKAFDASRADSLRLSTIGPIIFWPVTITPKYIDLLSERRPEALVILSHFGVLIHSRRDLWILGDSGLYIISAIKDYLGPSWESWLHYPNSFI
jgi:hypothetical protein